MEEGPLTDAELGAIEQRASAASKGPWRSFVEGRDHFSGDNFIRIGGDDDAEAEADMYVTRDAKPAAVEDLDFVAHARQDVPRLIAEIRRIRAT